jgi:hydrogenase maturation protein HypF
MDRSIAGKKIKVTGIVQGVGFRPFVYGLAEKYALAGWVRNSSSGVDIALEGPADALEQFLNDLQNRPPALARIDSCTAETVAVSGFSGFVIQPSLEEEGKFVPISPDMSICADCERELFDPHNRRYRYPFINCTNCGPRFSIIKDIPYDRPKTTMAGFKLCEPCQHEYENPLDRRFHAQPTACADCGPQVWLEADGHWLAEKEEAIQLARQWLREGKIVAIKGLGGYHLACDAQNETAVAKLRQRKKRSDKAFALMAFSVPAIQEFCTISPAEEKLLISPQHPIVLLQKRPESHVAASVAPKQNTLGFMLPYTPLHLLLLEPEAGFPSALVMTSGNLSEEPVAFVDEEALSRLNPIADGFLMNDRPIHMRVDDSVYRIVAGQPYPIRRSRGYAPQSIALPQELPQTLAVGAELKNTFCVTRENYAFLSHHIGDLENYETFLSFEQGIEHFTHLFRIQPEVVVADLHPDYLSTRYAQNYAVEKGLPLVQVQHHHAHLAACLADNGWTSTDPVIGFSFDGTGLGTDGRIWGSEVLVGGYTGFERRYHLAEMPLPGGDTSTHFPARIALAYLAACGLDWEPELPSQQALCSEERNVLRSQLNLKINCPYTTSMGRLFDAVSALIGIRQVATYEGQAAIELENLCDPQETAAYTLETVDDAIQIAPLFQQILTDWHQGLPAATISAKFHNGLAQLVCELSQQIRSQTGLSVVAFSGGVWQNITLLNKSLNLLKQAGFRTLIHRQVPTNDGGLSLGQVMIAAYARKN